jgi:calcium-dependent protein kinase
MNELLSAVAYCHKHHVVHRDLKPENILFTADSLKSAIKLVDFGISKDEFECTSKMRMYERSGTLPYMAPEMLSSDHGYDEKCDVWSCGVIMYFIITGRKPYNGTNNKHTLYLIQSGESNSILYFSRLFRT